MGNDEDLPGQRGQPGGEEGGAAEDLAGLLVEGTCGVRPIGSYDLSQPYVWK